MMTVSAIKTNYRLIVNDQSYGHNQRWFITDEAKRQIKAGAVLRKDVIIEKLNTRTGQYEDDKASYELLDRKLQGSPSNTAPVNKDFVDALTQLSESSKSVRTAYNRGRHSQAMFEELQSLMDEVSNLIEEVTNEQ